jgi:hypothetical protein
VEHGGLGTRLYEVTRNREWHRYDDGFRWRGSRVSGARRRVSPRRRGRDYTLLESRLGYTRKWLINIKHRKQNIIRRDGRVGYGARLRLP